MSDKSLYERLGGVFAIAAVIDHFSDAVVRNRAVGQDRTTRRSTSGTPSARPIAGPEIHAHAVGLRHLGRSVRLQATKPGSTDLGLENAHRELRISPAEFDEVAAELARSLDDFNVPEQEKGEVLAAFAAHKGEVTEGSLAAVSGLPGSQRLAGWDQSEYRPPGRRRLGIGDDVGRVAGDQCA